MNQTVKTVLIVYGIAAAMYGVYYLLSKKDIKAQLSTNPIDPTNPPVKADK